jgi:hypothetical protein
MADYRKAMEQSKKENEFKQTDKCICEYLCYFVHLDGALGKVPVEPTAEMHCFYSFRIIIHFFNIIVSISIAV